MITKHIFILYGEQAVGKTLLIDLLDEEKTEIIDDVILVHYDSRHIDTAKDLVCRIAESNSQFVVVSILKLNDTFIINGHEIPELQLLTDRLKSYTDYNVTICDFRRMEYDGR